MTQPADHQNEVETLKAELQRRDFLDAYREAGGVITEPHEITGQTKQNFAYTQIKPLIEKGRSISDLVSEMAASDRYQSYFSDTPTTTQQPTGRTISRKDFEAGKVNMDDVISGKVRVKG